MKKEPGFRKGRDLESLLDFFTCPSRPYHCSDSLSAAARMLLGVQLSWEPCWPLTVQIHSSLRGPTAIPRPGTHYSPGLHTAVPFLSCCAQVKCHCSLKSSVDNLSRLFFSPPTPLSLSATSPFFFLCCTHHCLK